MIEISNSPVLQVIIETVANSQQIKTDDVGNTKWLSQRHGISQRCPTKIAVAKQIVCYLAVKYPIHYRLIITRQVGAAIGHSRHTHVTKYYEITANRMEVDTDFCQKVIEIESQFLKNLMCTYSKFPMSGG